VEPEPQEPELYAFPEMKQEGIPNPVAGPVPVPDPVQVPDPGFRSDTVTLKKLKRSYEKTTFWA
jgi:hypothetical protein